MASKLERVKFKSVQLLSLLAGQFTIPLENWLSVSDKTSKWLVVKH